MKEIMYVVLLKWSTQWTADGLDEPDFVRNIESINISGKADESFLVTIRSIEKQKRISISLNE